MRGVFKMIYNKQLSKSYERNQQVQKKNRCLFTFVFEIRIERMPEELMPNCDKAPNNKPASNNLTKAYFLQLSGIGGDKKGY